MYAIVVQHESQKYIVSGNHGGGDVLEPTTLYTTKKGGGGGIDHLNPRREDIMYCSVIFAT